MRKAGTEKELTVAETILLHLYMVYHPFLRASSPPPLSAIRVRRQTKNPSKHASEALEDERSLSPVPAGERWASRSSEKLIHQRSCRPPPSSVSELDELPLKMDSVYVESEKEEGAWSGDDTAL